MKFVLQSSVLLFQESVSCIKGCFSLICLIQVALRTAEFVGKIGVGSLQAFVHWVCNADFSSGHDYLSRVIKILAGFFDKGVVLERQLVVLVDQIGGISQLFLAFKLSESRSSDERSKQ